MRCDMPTRSSASCTRCLRSARRHSPIGERQFHVLVHREIADQVERLENEADFAIADARALAIFRSSPACRSGYMLPSARRIEQAQDRQQSGLAAAGRPRDRNILALAGFQVDARKACVSTSSVTKTFVTFFNWIKAGFDVSHCLFSTL